MLKQSFSFRLIGASLVLAFASTANATSYSFTDLGTLGGTQSRASAINEAGQIAGWSKVAGDLNSRATLWNGTTATDLGTLGGADSFASDINAYGQVVGQAIATDGTFHGALWNGHTVTDLGSDIDPHAINSAGLIAGSYAGGYQSHAIVWQSGTVTDLNPPLPPRTEDNRFNIATTINEAGQVAGYGSPTAGYGYRATVWNGTIATELEALSGSYSYAHGINAAGQVVGQSSTTTDFFATRATLWNGATATDLGTLGGYSNASAINASGQIVGYSLAGGDAGQHATLWNGATAITDLNSFLDASTVSAGWVLEYANDINDKGWIVGSAANTLTGQTHAFLLTPVPEPTNYAMLLAGLGIIGGVARHKNVKNQATRSLSLD